jgi:hypothetical protein
LRWVDLERNDNFTLNGGDTPFAGHFLARLWRKSAQFRTFIAHRGSFPHLPPRPHPSRQSAGTAAKVRSFYVTFRGSSRKTIQVKNSENLSRFSHFTGD